MKDVVISIRGIQRSFHPGEEEQGPESVELVTDGRYEYGRDASWFTYQESEITGMEGTVTTIAFTPEGAVLTRQGSVTGRMDFSPGERNTFLYETPYGSSTVGMETKRYASTLTERGGKLEIEYVIDFDHAFVALNQMHIQVTEKKEY